MRNKLILALFLFAATGAMLISQETFGPRGGGGSGAGVTNIFIRNTNGTGYGSITVQGNSGFPGSLTLYGTNGANYAELRVSKDIASNSSWVLPTNGANGNLVGVMVATNAGASSNQLSVAAIGAGLLYDGTTLRAPANTNLTNVTVSSINGGPSLAMIVDTNTMVITNGQVGIGKIPATGFSLDVNNGAQVAGNLTLAASSSLLWAGQAALTSIASTEINAYGSGFSALSTFYLGNRTSNTHALVLANTPPGYFFRDGLKITNVPVTVGTLTVTNNDLTRTTNDLVKAYAPGGVLSAGVTTNGLYSLSTAATNAIAGVGYTNNTDIQQTAYVTATAVAFTIKDRSQATLYVSPTLTATMPVVLQRGWSITAASGLSGTVLPW